MKNKWRFTVVGFAAAFAFAHTSLAASAPVKPGTKGIVDIEYTFEGKNSYDSDRRLLSEDWRLKRVLKVSYEVYAGDLAIASALDESQNQQLEADSAAVSAQGNAMVANNADLMANMEKAAEACGDDEACMEKFAMQMARQPQTQKQLKNVQKDVAAVGKSAQAMNANSPPRFQVWMAKTGQPAKIGGEAGMDEALHVGSYDPTRHQRTNSFASDRSRNGKQAVDASVQELALTSPMVEVDTVKDLMSIKLPPPNLQVTVQEHTVAAEDGKKTEDETKKVPVSMYPGVIQEVEDGLKFLSVTGREGTKSVKLKGLDDYDGPVTFTVRWKFRGA